MYTIGQVAQMFDLPVSTLRYYDKEGLFPGLQRSGGIRQFDDAQLETLRVIECLKKSGMQIRDIKQFMTLCAQGDATFPARRELLVRQREAVEQEMVRLGRVLDMLRYKCWYYDQAMRDGGESNLRDLAPDQMPEEIRRAYENAYSDS